MIERDWRPIRELGRRCPFCSGPTVTAHPSVPEPREACADPSCDGAHGWTIDQRGYVPRAVDGSPR